MTRRAARTPGQAVILGHVSEAEFLEQVIHLAMAQGWLVHHSRPALSQSGRHMTALAGCRGLPDVIAVRAPRVLFAELKAERGRVEPDQRRWADALGASPGVEYRLWRPSDWDDVVATLRRE